MGDKRVNSGLPPGRASIACLFTWLGRRGDYNKEIDPNSLRGVSRHFNSVTQKGKANTVMLTYAVVGLLAVGFYFTKQKSPTKLNENV